MLENNVCSTYILVKILLLGALSHYSRLTQSMGIWWISSFIISTDINGLTLVAIYFSILSHNESSCESMEMNELTHQIATDSVGPILVIYYAKQRDLGQSSVKNMFCSNYRLLRSNSAERYSQRIFIPDCILYFVKTSQDLIMNFC